MQVAVQFSGFGFKSADTPSELAGQSPFYPTFPATTAFGDLGPTRNQRDASGPSLIRNQSGVRMPFNRLFSSWRERERRAGLER
jgi:hypothetical protein